MREFSVANILWVAMALLNLGCSQRAKLAVFCKSPKPESVGYGYQPVIDSNRENLYVLKILEKRFPLNRLGTGVQRVAYFLAWGGVRLFNVLPAGTTINKDFVSVFAFTVHRIPLRKEDPAFEPIGETEYVVASGQVNPLYIDGGALFLTGVVINSGERFWRFDLQSNRLSPASKEEKDHQVQREKIDNSLKRKKLLECMEPVNKKHGRLHDELIEKCVEKRLGPNWRSAASNKAWEIHRDCSHTSALEVPEMKKYPEFVACQKRFNSKFVIQPPDLILRFAGDSEKVATLP